MFGIAEIYEYEKTCTDPKVLFIIKQWKERGRKLALLTEENMILKQEIERRLNE